MRAVAILCVAFLMTTLALAQETQPLTNADVLTMVKAGLSAEIITAKIKASPDRFDTSPATLGELKNAGVPDAVILAMVKAVPAKPPESEKVYAKCDYGPIGIHASVSINAPNLQSINCGDAVTVLDHDGDYLKVRTDKDVEGYVLEDFVSTTKSETRPVVAITKSEPQPVVKSPGLLPNTLRAVAWRGVPWVSTSYYQQPGNASTYCSGSGTWYGSMSQTNLSCSTQYTPAQSVPMNWSHYTVYNLVVTTDSYMVITCTSNWRWSKCSHLIPGEIFSFEMKKGKVAVLGKRQGKNKVEELDFDMVSSEIKSR
jgi:hypothetical protein